MKFVFRFAKLLAYRRHQLREAQTALARAAAQVAQTQRLLEETQSTLENCRVQWNARAQEGLPVAEHLAFERYAAFLEHRLQNLRAALEAAQRQVQEKQRAVLERHREVKKLERLEEVDHERFRWQQKKREQKRLDELVAHSDGNPTARGTLS